MTEPDFIPLEGYKEHPVDEMGERAREFGDRMRLRRSIRHFSDRPIPREVISECLRTAGSAPSGANKQPWHFVVVTRPDLKRRIRTAAEAEEHEFYSRRAPREWLEVLKPLGTDEQKPFLETAPCLIVVFEQRYGLDGHGEKVKHYYTQESVGLATGFLLAALHWAGLATLTHTPSPMGFLNDILERPANERPFLIVVAGYPADGCQVPNIKRKPLEEIAEFL